MPVPTPPKQNLLKATPPSPVTKKAGKPTPRVPGRPSKATIKLSGEIKDLTENLEKNSVDISEEKPPKSTAPVNHVKPVSKVRQFVQPEHLTQSPFRESAAMRDLEKKMASSLERQPQSKPINKRTPRHNKATGEKS